MKKKKLILIEGLFIPMRRGLVNHDGDELCTRTDILRLDEAININQALAFYFVSYVVLRPAFRWDDQQQLRGRRLIVIRPNSLQDN